MDTAKLELAAQRCKDAEEALEAARADLRAEAVAALRSTDERGAQATVAHLTGWRRSYLRRLLRTGGERSA
ncbi:hypothetical protein [Streptomyces liangshanensis]|uniref:Uncharacterized protein n=1 Tax=Streptomyces liangshanensis TaxID=2717324 RepID=A0A6G9GUE9_9ACTN|nr:hypothetical protein [Streptomyces liangshanensis]QIQ01893.1 hypothetical protein HA039_05945 [Streptomyces liangshanensis]